MAVDPGCIFCKIAAGEIPSFKIYEDDIVFAFLDIGPLVKGHTLVVPKAHYPTIMETPGEALGAINERIPALSRAVLAATGARACHLLVNNGGAALQTVRHLHYHILPRAAEDGFDIPWHAGKLEQSAGEALQRAIRDLMPTQL